MSNHPGGYFCQIQFFKKKEKERDRQRWRWRNGIKKVTGNGPGGGSKGLDPLSVPVAIGICVFHYIIHQINIC